MLSHPRSEDAMRRRRWLRRKRLEFLFCIVFFFTTMPGFVCASRVERMEAKQEALSAQFVEIQKRMNNDQAQISAMALGAEEKVQKLEELQSKLSGLLQNNVIDFSSELEQLQKEIQALRGDLQREQALVARNQQVLVSIAESLNFDTSGQALQLPEDKAAHFALAQQKYAAQEWAPAETAFREFVARYPSDPLAEEAWLRQGEALIELGQHQSARRVLQQFVQKYQQSKFGKQAVFLVGKSSLAVGDCDTANSMLKYLKQVHPKYASELKTLKSQGECK